MSDIEEYEELEHKVIHETKSTFISSENNQMKISYSRELEKFTRKDYEEYDNLAHQLNLETRKKLIDFFEAKARKKIQEFHAEVLHKYDHLEIIYE